MDARTLWHRMAYPHPETGLLICTHCGDYAFEKGRHRPCVEFFAEVLAAIEAGDARRPGHEDRGA